MGLFKKVHVFEPIKVHTFGPNIRLIKLFSLMLNYAKPRLSIMFYAKYQNIKIYQTPNITPPHHTPSHP